MTASIQIYNLPSASIPDELDHFPMSTNSQTRKISYRNLITSIASDAKTVAFSFQSDDFVNVYGVTSGSRMFHPGNSIFYSIGTGSSNLILGNDIRLTNSRTPTAHTHSLSEIDTGSAVFLLSSSLGIANGVAPLDETGKVSVIYLPTSSTTVPHASQISASNLSILINPTSVQNALEKLSDGAYLYINSSSANVTGTNTVQGALNQKLSTTGGTVTGMLILNGGLRVGASDIWVVSNSVGIGTTTPTSKLDVIGVISGDGNLNIRRLNSVNDGGGITLYRASDNTADWKINQFGSRLRFVNSTGEKISVLDTGYVGVGTTTPTAKLEISGSSGVDGLRFPDGTLQTTAYVSGSGYQDVHINWPSSVNDYGMYVASHTTPTVNSYDVFVKRLRSDYPSDTLNGDLDQFPIGTIITLTGTDAASISNTVCVTSTRVFCTRVNANGSRMAGPFYYGDITSYDQTSGAVGYFQIGGPGLLLRTWYIPYANRDWEMYVRLYY